MGLFVYGTVYSVGGMTHFDAIKEDFCSVWELDHFQSCEHCDVGGDGFAVEAVVEDIVEF